MLRLEKGNDTEYSPDKTVALLLLELSLGGVIPPVSADVVREATTRAGIPYDRDPEALEEQFNLLKAP